MHRFPAHLPILEYGGDDDQWLATHAAEFLQGMRVGWISGDVDIAPERLKRLLLVNELILVKSGAAARASRRRLPTLTDVLGKYAGSDAEQAGGRLGSWLTECRMRTPLFGAVLIGGRSTRMGRPKHLIPGTDGCSWLERLIDLFEPFVTAQVVSGAGELPVSLAQIERVEDLGEVQGPLAGIAALLNQRPFVSWLVCACDMPYITAGAIEWLLARRKSGVAAIIPKNPETGRSEPLFAWYDYRCSVLVGDLIATGSTKVSDLCSHPAVSQPEIPPAHGSSWRNINYPDEV